MAGATRDLPARPGVPWRFATMAALAYAAGAGFFAAGFLGDLAVRGRAADDAYRTLAQAHGRAQAFGFGSLLALGIALNFLPKLRHAPLAWPRLATAAIALVVGGLALRLGPALALLTDDPAIARTAADAAIVGALATFAGTAVGAAALARTHLTAPTPARDSAIAPVVPMVAAAWVSLLVAQALDVVGTAASHGTGVVSPTLDGIISWLALPGWFVPLAMAFASRTFPLYLRTRLAPADAMRSWLGVFVVGLIADIAARAALIAAPLGAVGQVCEGTAIIGWVYALGIWRARPPHPGRITDPFVRRAEAITGAASEVAIVVACVWLAIAGAMLALGGVASLSGFGVAPATDVVRHAVGAGVMLPLIVGMAIRLLPGFAGDRPDRIGRVSAWVAALAAVGASVMRAGPATVGWLDAAGAPLGGMVTGTTWLFPAAVVGAGAIGALWWSLRRSLG